MARRSRDPGPDPDWCSTGVEPHEAPSGFRTDARTTWAEALVAVKVGAGVTEFRVSDEVFGIKGGANAEYVAVRESGVIALEPRGLTYEEAAAIFTELVDNDTFVEFLTLPAYERID